MTFIIAECSGNHGGDLLKAKEMIHAAKWCGCSAVKFQLYRKEDFPDQYNADWHFPIKEMIPDLLLQAEVHSIPIIFSIFGQWAVDYIRQWRNGEPYAFKLASPESTRLEPNTYERITDAVYARNNSKLFISRHLPPLTPPRCDVLFWCKPGYPATPLTVGELQIIRQWRGFSDHTDGILSTLAAIQVGATHIEKHFMLDKPCVDEAFSLHPDQMKMLCDLAK